MASSLCARQANPEVIFSSRRYEMAIQMSAVVMGFRWRPQGFGSLFAQPPVLAAFGQRYP
jgi:hypothetical protein